MAATLKDIEKMLDSEKLRAQQNRAFALPTKGFDGDDETIPVKTGRKKNTALAKKLMKNYRLHK